MRLLVLSAALTASLGTTACREREDSAVDTSASKFDTGFAVAGGDTALRAPRRDAAAEPTTPMTPDGSVLGAFIAASRHEIQHGRLAEQKAASKTVRDLGRTISRDHDDFVLNAQELGKRYGIPPRTAPADTTVAGHKDVMGDLRTATGSEFDRIFLEHEIDYHNWLINLVNTTMLPRAENAEVKTFLQQAIPNFQAHSKAASDLLKKPQP